MKLLITGGCGFIGSNFIRYTLNKHKDYEIVNLDKITYAGNPENLKEIEKDSRYTFIKGDICDEDMVGKAMKGCNHVVNFAAESHVDRSIEEPQNFVQTNFYGTYVLLEAARKMAINKFVQISCYDEKTRALTTEGLKTYKELKEGDLVFSLNPRTSEIEVKPVEKIIIQAHNGKMVHFNNQRVDLLVTPNHNMFILNTNKKKLLVERAEETAQRSIFYMPGGYWVGREEEYFDIKEFGKVKAKSLMYLLGIFIGDGFVAYQEREVETKTGLRREEFLRQGRDMSSGRFATVTKQSDYKSTTHSYRIFFDIPENDICRKKVEKILHDFGIKYHSHKGKAGTHLYFTSKALMQFFNQCGKGAHNKRIPRWALEYAPEYLKCLLQGLMDSDGNSAGTIYFTVSERLVSDICELCIKLNLKPSIYKENNVSFIEGRRVEGKLYYIYVAKTTKSVSRHRNKLVDYQGDIWCLKIRDNKNFLVERNGKLDFCGNTDEVYGSIEKGLFTEKSPLLPNSPYSASKAAADLLARSYYQTYKFPALITRSSNNFGPYQYPEKVIPLFITNAFEDKKLPVYGDGLNVRDWLYVLDNCEAIDLVLRKGKTGEIYNIGGASEITNLKLTELLLEMLKKKTSLIEFVTDRLGHDRRYALDCAKINRLGWKPRHDFKTALKETIEWYKNNKDWWMKLKDTIPYR